MVRAMVATQLGRGTKMSTRITIKDAEQALRVYCARAGVPYGHYLTVKPGDGAETHDVEQNGRTFTAHLLHTMSDRDSYVITGGLALSGAYGGWQVQRIIGADPAYLRDDDPRPCTGVTTPFGEGYAPAREMYVRLRGATEGLELARGER